MSEVVTQSVDLIQCAVDELMVLGKKRGYVTWEEMNRILPDDAIDPSRLETILMHLEDAKIDTLDEIDARSYERKRKKRGARSSDAAEDAVQSSELARSVVDEDAGVKRIDDPVRMYLTQMGEIPLLSREEEIRLAKKIELCRMAFRQKVLESDYCSGLAVEILQQVNEGRLPFDRTMKISTSEHMAKTKISMRIPVNLATARNLMGKNDEAWTILSGSRVPAATRREYDGAMRGRRRKISKLLEELSLRTSRIQPLMKRLRGLHNKMKELESRIAAQQKRRTMLDEDFVTMKDELFGIESLCMEKSAALGDRLRSIQRVFSELRRCQA